MFGGGVGEVGGGKQSKSSDQQKDRPDSMRSEKPICVGPARRKGPRENVGERMGVP